MVGCLGRPNGRCWSWRRPWSVPRCWITRIPSGPPGPPGSHVWGPDAWPWAAAWSLLALVVLMLLVALGRRIPSWAQSLGLVSLAIMWLSGPAHVYFKRATGARP